MRRSIEYMIAGTTLAVASATAFSVLFWWLTLETGYGIEERAAVTRPEHSGSAVEKVDIE